MNPCTFNVPCHYLDVLLLQDRTRHSSVDHSYRRQCLKQTFAHVFSFSNIVWCSRLPMSTSASFGTIAFRILFQESLTIVYRGRKNRNCHHPHTGQPQHDHAAHRYHHENVFPLDSVCLLSFVLGCILSALTPKVKFASIFLRGNCSPFHESMYSVSVF